MEHEQSSSIDQSDPNPTFKGVAPIDVTSTLTPEQLSSELSSRRTGMSFQRTRMSADRTLMSVLRTALSLITFGFTLFQTFQHLRAAKLLSATAASTRFASALVLLGVVMLVLGIGYHIAFMNGLRRERRSMIQAGMIRGESHYPISLVLVVAVLLLAIGSLAFSSMVLSDGPFS